MTLYARDRGEHHKSLRLVAVDECLAVQSVAVAAQALPLVATAAPQTAVIQ